VFVERANVLEMYKSIERLIHFSLTIFHIIFIKLSNYCSLNTDSITQLSSDELRFTIIPNKRIQNDVPYQFISIELVPK